MPKQFYVLLLALLLYFWPWSIGSGSYLLGFVITLQIAFVMSCNFLVKERWKYAVILIEGFCMLFNVTFFLVPSLSPHFHEQIMLCAFIIELLIITISLQGVIVGRSNSYHPSLANRGLWSVRGGVLHLYRSAGADQ